MGLCFSKKKKPCSDPTPDPNGKKAEQKKVKKKESRKEQAAAPKKATEPPVCEKKPVFIVTKNTSKPTASDEKEKKKSEAVVLSKKPQIKKQEAETKPAGTAPPAEEIRPVPVRTSSCTKEEVDAILIQCGRLSRSSSGKTSAETGHHRRYSGSKRSFDFDHEKRGEEEDEERHVSRPSPHRRTPSRERSGSRERGTGGTGRRVSRSPGRRSEVPTNSTTVNEKPKPAKMVSVPAREKAGSSKSGTGTSTGSAKRNASPRSRSPGVNGVNRSENVGTLSRSSSRKGEHSPFRRNPMAEIDENSMKGSQSGFKSQKTNQTQSQKTESVISSCKGSTDETKSHTIVTNCIRDQFVTCRVKDSQDSKKTEEQFDPLGSFKSNEINFTSISAESFNSKSVISTNRSSRDFDHQNPNSYTNLLLEDIQNYHQTNNPNPNSSPNPVSFSLPACVSKACSILEAVADLNSSSSDVKRGFAPKEPFLESEIMVKDDLMEPSMHKYVSVRDLGGEVEPQESAGSNSFVGGQTWEPNSVDSTDKWARSQSNNGDEVELEGPVGSTRQSGADRRLGKKREGVERQVNRNLGSGRSGSRITGSGC